MPISVDFSTEAHDREALCASIRAGWKPKYLFFWGHAGGSVTAPRKECLSQWYPAPFRVGGVAYPTAEHFMMAEKARLFGDLDAERAVLNTAHPGAAKKFGRNVCRYDDALWRERRFEIVIAGNMGKFSQNPALRSFLLGTTARVLVEASPMDSVWGIGLAANDARATNPLAWPGKNLLGFALMAVRRNLDG